MTRSVRSLVLMFAVPALLVVGALSYFQVTARFASTDNAYIQQDKISVSAEVGGRLVAVGARENARVKAGDLLFRIDPQPYQLAVDEAKVAIETAKARLEELKAALVSANVEIDSANDDIAYFDKEFRRQQALLKTSVTTEANLQAAEHKLTLARAALATAQAEAAEAKAAIATGVSAVANAKVQLAIAKLNLARTVVRSPATGVVSQADRLQLGQLMMQSLPAVTIVRTDASWVEANFKETDLTNMKVGQPVEITLDTYPDMKLHGRVDSIGAGTGSEFSILPAQNANANWVKVTQRVPVRIAILDQPAQHLIAGLSVHVRIDISH